MGSKFCGGHSGRVTPGLIPNPVAKPASADGTALEGVWESKTPPQLNIDYMVLWGGHGYSVRPTNTSTHIFLL